MLETLIIINTLSEKGVKSSSFGSRKLSTTANMEAAVGYLFVHCETEREFYLHAHQRWFKGGQSGR